MAIKDVEKRKSDRQAALEPRPIFLWFSLFAAVAAITVFLMEDSLVDPSVEGSAMGFALTLIALVMIAAFFVLCYRSPAFGNRLLGYSGLMERNFGKKVEDKGSSAISGGGLASVDSAIGAKRQNTQRKRARHLRKQTAAATRAMQAEEKHAEANQPKDQNNQSDDKE